jgi:hypothetical protein
VNADKLFSGQYNIKVGGCLCFWLGDALPLTEASPSLSEGEEKLCGMLPEKGFVGQATNNGKGCNLEIANHFDGIGDCRRTIIFNKLRLKGASVLSILMLYLHSHFF